MATEADKATAEQILDANNLPIRFTATTTSVRNAKLRDDIATALASARAAEWQPIETAPKDRSRVLGVEGAEIRIVRYEQIAYRRIQGWWDVFTGQLVYPTHWMPLPDPPDSQ